MEVTSLNFESIFPEIIGAYLRCSFLTIDCEFSGIRAFEKDEVPVRTSLRRQPGAAPPSAEGDPDERKTDGGEESLLREEAYRRLRSAAQKYTVLQLGLTFAWPDDHKGNGGFNTETYSFLVHPFVDWSTGEGARACRAIVRDVTVNSATAQFLQSSKFNFHTLFMDGLRYLSHVEEKRLRDYISVRHRAPRKTEKGYEQEAEEDEEDERTRCIIKEWLAHDGARPGEYLHLFSPKGKPMTRSWVSRVHSIARYEFENCRSWKDPRENCIVVKHVDPVVEEERQAEQSGKMSAEIRKAIGLRNVIDLIIGNDLSEQVILEEFAEVQVRATELNQWEPRSEAEKSLEREAATKVLGEKLQQLRPPREAPIVVGHNIGWDLAFLIEAFLHPLPDTLAEFVRTVDSMFPRLLDTRILAGNHSSEFKDLDLSAIHAVLAGDGDQPRCYWEAGRGYRTGSAHNAGYDSFITTEVLLKMGQRMVVDGAERRSKSKPDQTSIDKEIADWDSSIWDPFRGKFMVHGQLVRE